MAGVDRAKKHDRVAVASFMITTFFVFFVTWFTISSNNFADKTARHPLSFTYINGIHQNEEKNVRYLTFGSSSTWGLGLDDVHKSAYPWLLSPEVHNVASRVGGPSVSALCTESIVGERIYDVIVIEFFQGADEGLLQLARRIRKRFPNAAIVFVQLWSLDHVLLYHHRRPDGPNATRTTEVKSFTSWRKEQVKTSGSFDSEYIQKMLLDTSMSGTDHYYWSFANFSKQEDILKQAAEEVQGHLYTLPYPEKKDATVALITPDYMQFFQDDHPGLLSEKGHATVAEGIKDILHNAEKEIKVFDLDRPNRNEVGSWEERDHCSMWYATGVFPSSVKSYRGTALVKISRPDDAMIAEEEYDSGNKYALEVTNSRRGGSIYVTNPFNESRMLYLTYMTAGKTMKGKKIYPKTKVFLDDKPTVILDPFHEDDDSDSNSTVPTTSEVRKNNLRQASSSSYYYNYNRHLTRTTAVGVIEAGGKTLLNLKPQESARNYFRLVGISILEDEIVDSVPFEFAMEPETIVERRIKQLGIKW